jgi:hypothetical protein
MKKKHEVPPDIAAELIVGVLQQLILDGEISAKGKSTEELYQAYRAWVKECKESGFHFQGVTDHTSTIWKLAAKAEKSDKIEFACLYYATWAEHQLNQIVVVLCKRRGYEDEVSQMLIRDTGFKAKFLWIHCLLRRKPRKAILDSLNTLSEIRNQIVHYKWKPWDDSASERSRAALKKAHAGLTYLRHLVDERLLAGSKKQLKVLEGLIRARYEKDPLVI